MLQSNEEEIKNLKEHFELKDWVNVPTLDFFKEHITMCKPSHNDVINRFKHYDDIINTAYRDENNYSTVYRTDDDKKEKKNTTRSQIESKLTQKYLSYRYTILEEPFLSSDDLFKVKGVTHLDVENARQHELILNKQFRTDIDRVDFVNKVIKSYVDYGTAIVRVGWKTEEFKGKREVDVYYKPEELLADPQLLSKLMQVPQEQLTEENVTQFMIALTESGMQIKKGTVIKKNQTIKREMPTVRVVDPKKLMVDTSCGNSVKDLQYTIEMIETTLSDVKKNSIYKNLDGLEDEIPENNIVDLFDLNTVYDREQIRNLIQKMYIYEYNGYYDVYNTGKRVLISCSFTQDRIIRLSANIFPDNKLPYVFMRYMPSNFSIYGECDVDILHTYQRVDTAIVRGIVDLFALSANSQVGIAEGFLDDTELENYKSGKTFMYNKSIPPSQGIYQFKFPELPSSVLHYLEKNRQDAETATGIRPFSAGEQSGTTLGNGMGNSSRSLDASNKKEISILRRLSKGFEDIARKIMTLNSTFLSDENILRISDEEYRKIRRDDLAGDFDLNIDISTAETNSDKVNTLSFLLQTAVNNLDGPQYRGLIAQVADLNKMPDVAKAIRDYQEPSNPYAQELLRIDYEQKQADLELTRSKTKENMADISVRTTKAGVNEATKGKIQAETDKIAVNNADSLTGLGHQREMDKITAKNMPGMINTFNQNNTTMLDPMELEAEAEAFLGGDIDDTE